MINSAWLRRPKWGTVACGYLSQPKCWLSILQDGSGRVTWNEATPGKGLSGEDFVDARQNQLGNFKVVDATLMNWRASYPRRGRLDWA